MAELKKCPFCGGEATPVYCENGNRYTSNILHFSKRGTIKCKKCELTLPRVYSKVSKAIEAWNNRATDAEIRALAISEFAKRVRHKIMSEIDECADELEWITEIEWQLKEE